MATKVLNGKLLKNKNINNEKNSILNINPFYLVGKL